MTEHVAKLSQSRRQEWLEFIHDGLFNESKSVLCCNFNKFS